MKVIVCTPSARPHLFEHVINHLRICSGIDNYLLINCVDNEDEKIRQQVESIDFCETKNFFNRIRSTCEYNTYKSLSMGFEVSDYVIHIEEDILLARDALQYFEDLSDYNKFDDISTIVSYFRTKSDIDLNKKFSLLKTKGFQSWGWATWKDRFEKMCQHRMFDKTWGGYDYGGQTFNVRNKLYTIVPLISRSKNIGYPNEEYNKTHLSVDIWSHDHNFGDANWQIEGFTHDPDIRNRLVGIMASSMAFKMQDFYQNTRGQLDTI